MLSQSRYSCVVSTEVTVEIKPDGPVAFGKNTVQYYRITVQYKRNHYHKADS